MCRNSLKSFDFDFELMPINHQENILISIMELSSELIVFIHLVKKTDY